jgi:hypothetical protein
MKRTYVFFGPPGVGKTTLVEGYGGLDLERFSSRDRKDIAELLGRAPIDIVAIGAADTQPDQWDARFYLRVLLLPDREVYNRRRAERDAQHPHKAGQADVYDNFEQARNTFDCVAASWSNDVAATHRDRKLSERLKLRLERKGD